MAKVYKALWWACYTESIWYTSPELGEQPSPAACEVRHHLIHEPWIFLPNHRRGSLNASHEEQGTFLPAKSLALYDRSGLLSDRQFDGVSGDMVWTVSQSVCSRTVKEHYKDPDVRALFREWGVPSEFGWDVYLDVLRTVDGLVSAKSQDHVWDQDKTLHLDRIRKQALSLVGHNDSEP